MRGAGSLKQLIGKPVYGSSRQAAPDPEAELCGHAPKKRNTRATAAAAPGQRSILGFFAPAASGEVQEQAGCTQAGQQAPAPSCQRQPQAQHDAAQPTRGRSAPPRSSTPDGCLSQGGEPATQDAHTSASAGLQQQHPQQQEQCIDQDQGASPTAVSSQPAAPAPADAPAISSQQQLLRLAQAPLLVVSRIVGRQHQQASVWPPPGSTQLVLQREPSNRVDPHAVLVCGGAAGASDPDASDARVARQQQCVYGHLPATVACQLSPLLDAGVVTVSVQPAAADSVPQRQQQPQQQQAVVELQVQVAAALLQQEAAAAAAVAAVQRAAAAAGASLAPGRSSGTVLSEAFEHILTHTRQHDAHLLSDAERQVLQHMQALPAPCKALLLRLLLRKRAWFQLSALSSYSEVPQPQAAASRLAAVGLLLRDSDTGADLTALLGELALPTLRQVLGALLPRGHPAVAAAGGASASKAAVIASIQANACRRRLAAAISAAAGPCVTISPAAAETFARLQLLYFASPGQDISMFVALERGATRYPPYPIHRTRSAFASRQQLLEYEAALSTASAVDAALEANDTQLAWQLVQPALAALRAGAHKAVVWDESCARMPNPPPGRPDAAADAAAAAADAPANAADAAPLPEQCTTTRSSSKDMRVSSSAASDAAPGQGGSEQEAGSVEQGSESLSSSESSSSVSWDTLDTQQQQQQQQEAGAVSGPDGCGRQQPEPAAAAGAAAAAAAAPPPLFLARFCAGWAHASVGTVAASLLERRQDWHGAVDLLRLLLGGNGCVSRRGEWWTRLAINLEHLGRPGDALEAVEAALADGWVRGGDLLGLQRRLLRLGKPPRRWKRPSWAASVGWEPAEVVIHARPLANPSATKSRFFAPDDSCVSVEELALQHYASPEGGRWAGLHSEGGVWGTLFGLLLWDVLFMGVPDVFRSPFQTAPLDLDSDAFYPARRSQLDAALTRIADGHAGAILSDVWARHAGVFARGVSWQRFGQQQLLDICECVGGLGLAAVLRLMAEDHAGATGGLPDLLLWRPADKAAKMVEVKGPRDRLSHQQRFWLAHMAASNLSVEVLKVKELPTSGGDNSGTKRARK